MCTLPVLSVDHNTAQVTGCDIELRLLSRVRSGGQLMLLRKALQDLLVVQLRELLDKG